MRQRLDYLDGLRAIAALAVVFQHAIEMTTQPANFAWPLLHSINLGRFGVTLFFLLSGFVIPFSFSGPTPIRSFARSRVLRILPAFWLSIAVGMVLRGPMGMGDTLLNMALLAKPLGTYEISGVHWSLSFEAGFYLFCAVAFWRGWLENPRVIIRLLGVLLAWCVLARDESRIFFCYMLTGLLLRMALLEGQEEARRAWPFMCAMLMAVSGFAGWKYIGHEFLAPWPKLMGNVLPVPVFVAIVLAKPRAPRWLVYFGTISFSIYLFQDIGLHVSKPLVETAPLAYPLAAMAVTIAVSALTYRYVERPFNALGKRKRVEQPAIPAPAIP